MLVDGRTFAISDEGGDIWAPTHGLVHDDLRHLSRFNVSVDGAQLEILACNAPTPLSAVVVGRLGGDAGDGRVLVIRRRWVASGMREDIQVRNTSPSPRSLTMRVAVGADFAHLFDVKAGKSSSLRTLSDASTGWKISDPGSGERTITAIGSSPPPDEVDLAGGELSWHLHLDAGQQMTVCVTVEPVVDHVAAGLPFPCGTTPSDAIPVRRQANWLAGVPTIVSTDPRYSVVLGQALADIAALRIVDADHLDRVVIAAGAPWFMTLFGRDSLLSSWMTLPFDANLAVGVLTTLAELQGNADDPASEEQPGKILHELRRRGGSGPFARRDRYYGTVDATPLFIMLAAEAWRWGALSGDDLAHLGPHVDAALRWLLCDGDSNGDGFVDYRRHDDAGLSNQGWKDSWDGITFADGSIPSAPIALAEVQGYSYAALLGAVDLAAPMNLSHDPEDLRRRADALKLNFNQRFWNQRGWFAVGLDGDGRQIDSLTTNPGHALWTGIADNDKAHRYLDQIMQPHMWTGWGLRTLADTMGAYDPLSYHNGSVWPHDTAICAAGAARYGRWDVVDRIVDGAFDAAVAYHGRPPELFSGISRSEVPVPVSYPSSCSPQAWSSASILLLIRTMLDLTPDDHRTDLRIGRTDLRSVPSLVLQKISFAGQHLTVNVEDGVGIVRRD